jgi:hypothetical protein
MTDRHTLIRALEKSGMRPEAAEEVGTEIYDAIHDNVATRADLQRVEAGLRADLERVEAALRADLRRVEAELERVEAGLRAELERVEAGLRADLQTMELRLNNRIDRVVLRLGAALVVGLGLLFTALHQWPPHG